MRTELICVGTELLSGKLNTNVGYIGDKLSAIGLDLSLVTTVGDDQKELVAVFNRALEKNSLVIVTGGLGPTFDDLTREALSESIGRPLVLNREALQYIVQYFIKKDFEMPKSNERQAYLIEGGQILQNKAGTAPGQFIELEKKKDFVKGVFLLPGPPREMQLMFDEYVFPYLKKLQKGIKKSFVLHIAGMGESVVDEKIRPIIEAERKVDKDGVQFTILAHHTIVDIKASVSGKNELLIDDTVSNLKAEFREALGNNIYGEGRQNLESVIGGLLGKARKTLALAESCTGGMIAQRITSVQGSSMYFREGIVAYSNEAKVKLLGVKDDTLKEHGAVSENTAKEMAEGIQKRAGSDYAVSVTGIAGPGGGTTEKPVGLVYIGVSGPDFSEVFKFNIAGSRGEIRERAANLALDLLRRKLVKAQIRNNPNDSYNIA